MSRSRTDSFVLTVKLNTSAHDDKILNDRFFAGFLMYNKLVTHARRALVSMRQDKEYRVLMDQYISAEDKKMKRQLSARLSAIRRKHGLSEYQFHSWIAVQKRKSKGIDIHVAQKVATSVWKSTEAVLFRKGKTIHHSRFDDFLSLEGKNNSSGIRFKKGRIEWNGLCIQPDYDSSDEYEKEALKHRVKYCRIVRRPMGLHYHYYLQLILEGMPPVKHKYTDGRVGIDPGISTEAIVSDKGCLLVELSRKTDTSAEIRRIQRRMDRSRRTNNPECFNPDGTYIKGRKLKHRSHSYKQNQMKLKSLLRRNSADALQQQLILANAVLEQYGTDIITESMSYEGLQKRASRTTVSEKSGRYRSKKRYGGSILNHAPSRFIRILEQKLSYIGKSVHKVNTYKYRASQYDHTSGEYSKINLNTRSKIIDGHHVQRDLYSAFLLMCAQDEEMPDNQMCTEKFELFSANHDREIERLLKENASHPLCMGLRYFA